MNENALQTISNRLRAGEPVAEVEMSLTNEALLKLVLAIVCSGAILILLLKKAK
jgi:hypothetical protein